MPILLAHVANQTEKGISMNETLDDVDIQQLEETILDGSPKCESTHTNPLNRTCTTEAVAVARFCGGSFLACVACAEFYQYAITANDKCVRCMRSCSSCWKVVYV